MNAGSEGSVTGHDAGTSLLANDAAGMTRASIIIAVVAKQKRCRRVMRPP